MNDLMSGAIAMASFVAGLFFLRFWRKTRDRFFALFALSFWLMALNRLALSILQAEDESRPFLYLIRLFAFVLILVAFLDKNRAKR